MNRNKGHEPLRPQFHKARKPAPGADETAPSVKIAEFKARLSHYLRTVRAGHALTVMDRQTPIARLTPINTGGNDGGLVIRKATKKPSEVKLPSPLKKKVDLVKLLLEDRESGR